MSLEAKNKHQRIVMDKMKEQLGMNPSTANGRLVKDLLYEFVKNADIKCYRCNEDMTRETFSIEHIIPWIDSPNPVLLYFDINNISYSHRSCNSAAKRYLGAIPHNKGKFTHGTSGYRIGCRCEVCKTVYSDSRRKKYASRKN